VVDTVEREAALKEMTAAVEKTVEGAFEGAFKTDLVASQSSGLGARERNVGTAPKAVLFHPSRPKPSRPKAPVRA
jgi:hypothetical protein